MAPTQELDALVVGAGFGGVYMLYNLRKLGFNVKLVERGSNYGGTWFWNCYPGARVDSPLPIYQLSDRELWEDWSWTELYPSFAELRKYFEYVDKKWNLSKDVQFNTEVTAAQFDEDKHQWLVTCGDGSIIRTRWFVNALGFASKRYLPPIKGLESFKGVCIHTSVWPQEGIDLKDKRVGIIGTGASGVQTIQEIGPEVARLTVYQRTPNLAIPMRQEKVEKANEDQMKADGLHEAAFRNIRTTFAAFEFDFLKKNTFDVTPEERRAIYDKLWTEGGFRFWLAAFQDLFFDQAASDEAYKYWCEQIRVRINDPKKKDLLAPLKAPHPWGTKRPCLEQNYYEIYNQPNVDLIDVSECPIEEITSTGVRTREGHVELDVLILATGFDSVTGGLTQINITGVDGVSIKDKWADSVKSYLGMTVSNFPNMFYLYGPQAPTAFCNGPTCCEFQGEWICQALLDMQKDKITRLEATKEAEGEWTQRVADKWTNSLFPKARSWYQGSNIPGKKVEPLNWSGGVPAYLTACKESRENGYRGFKLSGME